MEQPKSLLETEHDNFNKYVKNLMKDNRLPKYTKASIEQSVAKNHNCMNIKGFWVQLYPNRTKTHIEFLPKFKILEELNMSKNEFLKKYPDKKILINNI